MPDRVSGVRACKTCGQHVRIGDSGRVPAHTKRGKPCLSAGKLAGSVTEPVKVAEERRWRAKEQALREAERARNAESLAERATIRESERAEREQHRTRLQDELGGSQSVRASSGGLPTLGRR